MNLEELRARLGSPHPPMPRTPQAGATPIEQCVPGQVLDGPRGEVFAADSVRGPEQGHGLHLFSSLARFQGRGISMLLAESQASVDLSKTAFIDTETTGLGYGVGTHVFMIGVGALQGDVFRVRQFFLRHPGEELAMLGALSEYLEGFDTIVSFNGRSFDWPLIENRFVFRRLPLQPADPVHIDLLHISRRLWKSRLENCSMGTIESRVLGVSRTRDDVEGWMIPQLYFQYLRTGNARPLERVFYHNLQDILSLAILTVHVEMTLSDPWGGLVTDPVDFLSLGRVFQSIGAIDLAVRCYQHAMVTGLPSRYEPIAQLRLAVIEKRRRNWDVAVRLLKQVAQRPGFERIACVELAKYHEHVARDHQEAMKLTVRAMRAAEFPSVASWPGIRRIELQHRHRRLTNRTSLGQARAS